MQYAVPDIDVSVLRVRELSTFHSEERLFLTFFPVIFMFIAAIKMIVLQLILDLRNNVFCSLN